MKKNPMAWVVAGLIASTSVGAETARQNSASGDGLLLCDVSMEQARSNLQEKGYRIEVIHADRALAHYKTSEKDSTRRMLGSFDVQKERQYVIESVGAGKIRFLPRFRETQFATGVLNSRHDVTREYDVTPTPEFTAALEDMRKEVCGTTLGSAKSDSKMPIEAMQYLLNQCRAGDARACELINVR